MSTNDSNAENQQKSSASRRQPSRSGERSSHGPAYYYGKTPYYGGSRTYGAYYDGGMPYYGGAAGRDEQGDGNSIFGPVSLSRIIRVMQQKWPTVVVAILLGLGAGFAYYKAAPVVYKAECVIEMQVKSQGPVLTENLIVDPSAQGPADEIFNSRLAKLRTGRVVQLVMERVRADYPALKTTPDDELIELIVNGVEFNPQKKSRLIVISAKSSQPETAQAIANAYAATAESFSMDENQANADAAVEWLKTTLDQSRRALAKADADVLQYKEDFQLDSLRAQSESLKLSHQQLSAELATAISEQTYAETILAVLTAIQKTPGKIQALPENVPRAAEIAASQKEIQDAVAEREALLATYTDKHPEVVQIDTKIETLNRQFKESVFRARETAVENLKVRSQLVESLQARREENVKAQNALGKQISQIESRLDQLLRERTNAADSYQNLLHRMDAVRQAADATAATTRVIEPAALPRRQISPDPRIAFSAGPILGFMLGFIFILILDRVEDRITSSEDIERHLQQKILALLPHVPRITRDRLVSLTADKKFSRFAEAFAGLRGLLDSPRFIDSTKVVLLVSTQPEEGKTITSSNLAVAYGMAGRKTLLVDFDLRRPRIGRMFGKSKEITEKNSLVDVLNRDEDDFSELAIASGYDNLDIVCSRPTSSISPANVMGADALPRFFEWARETYDHVVIDSPPFGLVSDALALGALSDAAIIVCRPEKSRYRVVSHAIRSLSDSGTKILGVVVNDVDFGRGSFSNYSYGTSGYAYHKYGRYGRYGYGGGYYKRSAADAADEDSSKSRRTGANAAADEADQGSESVLDIDDD